MLRTGHSRVADVLTSAMPTADGTYSSDERRIYRAPPCPHCGRRQAVRWRRDESPAGDEPNWVPETRCAVASCEGSDPALGE